MNKAYITDIYLLMSNSQQLASSTSVQNDRVGEEGVFILCTGTLFKIVT